MEYCNTHKTVQSTAIHKIMYTSPIQIQNELKLLNLSVFKVNFIMDVIQGQGITECSFNPGTLMGLLSPSPYILSLISPSHIYLIFSFPV